MKADYPCDMHCHTNRSDGNDSPLELIDNAAALGMFAIAITDHDITPPLSVKLADGAEMDIVRYAADKGVKLVGGYEFSCDTFVDDVHICGYRMDWSCPGVTAEVESAAISKSDAYRRLCVLLTAQGMAIDWQHDILTYTDSNGAVCTRTDEEVQRKHIFEAMAEHGYVKSWTDGKILVRDNPVLNVRRCKIDPADAIKLIHDAGGIAILAHPYLIDEVVHPKGEEDISRATYIDRLIAAGLDGIEASYNYDKTTYKGDMTPEQIEAEVRSVYQGAVKYISGGSDYHADGKKGSANVREIGERGISVKEFNAIFS